MKKFVISTQKYVYYLVDVSSRPLVTTLSLFFLVSGAVGYFHHCPYGVYQLLLSLIIGLLYFIFVSGIITLNNEITKILLICGVVCFTSVSGVVSCDDGSELIIPAVISTSLFFPASILVVGSIIFASSFFFLKQ